MRLYRLTKSKYSRDLSGKGAEKSGGRWNSKGTSMLYTAPSIALATAEVAVHIPLGILPRDYNIVSFNLPEMLTIKELFTKNLPENWRSIPHSNSTQLLGDAFVNAGDAFILKVPSAVIPGEINYLINPGHANIKSVSILSIETYEFDTRLFVR